jgi:NarL family two-component system response regulator LiaR
MAVLLRTHAQKLLEKKEPLQDPARGAHLPYPLGVKKAVLLYGGCGGLLIVALRLVEYRFLVVEHSIEIYGGLIALVFAAVGIRLGLTLTRTKEVVVVREVPVPDRGFVRNDAKAAELGITPRELEILQHIASGMSTREMAGALFVSENTVKTHATRLFDKLNVNRRTQAVHVARSLGLIP